MKKANFMIAAMVALAITLAPLSAVAQQRSKKDEGLKTAFASAARTSTETSPSFDLSDSDTIIGYLSVTDVTGTSPALAVKIQDSMDGIVWADLVSFTQVTGVMTEAKVPARKFGKYIRVVATITGTTPSFTFSFKFTAYKTSQA